MPVDEVCLKYRSQTSVVELRIVIIILTFKRHSTENFQTRFSGWNSQQTITAEIKIYVGPINSKAKFIIIAPSYYFSVRFLLSSNSSLPLAALLSSRPTTPRNRRHSLTSGTTARARAHPNLSTALSESCPSGQDTGLRIIGIDI